MIKTAATALAIMAISAEASLLDLDVNLPLGINVDLSLLGPKEGPCHECIDLWHPAHDVIIDDCDDTGNDDWHWVHPCPEPHEPEYTWATSTVTATHISTIIGCPPEVSDCPGHSTVYTTVTATGETTICPVPVETTHPVPEVPHTTTEVYNPPPTTYPEVPVPPPVETYVPQPPTEVPEHPSSIWTGPVPTLSTSVYVPVEPVPVPHPTSPNYPPVQPPVHTPVVPVPNPPVSQPTYGDNATVPVTTPPIVTIPPVPTAAAGRNAQNFGMVLAAGAIAAYVL